MSLSVNFRPWRSAMILFIVWTQLQFSIFVSRHPMMALTYSRSKIMLSVRSTYRMNSTISCRVALKGLKAMFILFNFTHFLSLKNVVNFNQIAPRVGIFLLGYLFTISRCLKCLGPWSVMLLLMLVTLLEILTEDRVLRLVGVLESPCPDTLLVLGGPVYLVSSFAGWILRNWGHVN